MIETPVVEFQDEFTSYTSTTVPYDSGVQVSVKHNFSKTFDRGKFYEETVGKGEFHNLVTHL